MFCFYDDDSDDIHRERQMNGSVSFREEMTRDLRFLETTKEREQKKERKREKEKESNKKRTKLLVAVIVVPR